jgi:hypothetical protein
LPSGCGFWCEEAILTKVFLFGGEGIFDDADFGLTGAGTVLGTVPQKCEHLLKLKIIQFLRNVGSYLSHTA